MSDEFRCVDVKCDGARCGSSSVHPDRQVPEREVEWSWIDLSPPRRY